MNKRMFVGIIFFSMVAVGASPTTATKNADTPPRNLNDASVAEAQIQDDDLKQAAEWLDKSEQSKTTKAATIETAEIGTAATTVAATAVEPTTATAETTTAPMVQKAEANLKEEEIPVLTTADTGKKIKKDTPISRVVASLGILLAMLFGTWVFYKKWARKDKEANKNTRIKVLTQHYLGPRKSLAIIRVAGESILVGITEQNITMIKSLSLLDDDIPTESPTQFSKSLETAQTKQTANEEPEDEFSLTKIKDFVSDRLKGMKEI